MKKVTAGEIPNFEMIEAAVKGDVESINQIVRHLQPYINSRCKRKFVNEFGDVQYVMDEHMKRRLETKLITKILDFKMRVE